MTKSIAGAIAPPVNRGRLLYVDDVATEIFRGRKSAWWVRHNVAPTKKIKIGRDCAWYESDVHEWLQSQRG
jgi:predicted DNA-binding transcriptional regulator AlpA